jgi:hypothetical protein
MKTVDEFYERILSTKNHPRPGYGGTVLPAMEIYADIQSSEERRAYQAAIERMLRAKDEDTRNFAVDLCLGFFVFRDVLRRPQ